MTPIFLRMAISASTRMMAPFMSKAPKSAGKVSEFQRAKYTKLSPATQISATTAGRRPFSMPFIRVISPYFFNRYITKMQRKKDGVTKPAVAAIEPGSPATLVPQKVAAFTPTGPGVIWEIVKISINWGMVIQ